MPEYVKGDRLRITTTVEGVLERNTDRGIAYLILDDGSKWAVRARDFSTVADVLGRLEKLADNLRSELNA